MPHKPIVMVSSYPPRLCGIVTFAEEAREFIQKVNPDRKVLVVSHTDGGLLFTTKKMLREKVIELACDEGLRLKLGENLKRSLDNVVSWEIVGRQYNQAFALARGAKRTGNPVVLDPEF